jgi:hypothetical protein
VELIRTAVRFEPSGARTARLDFPGTEGLPDLPRIYRYRIPGRRKKKENPCAANGIWQAERRRKENPLRFIAKK